MKHLILLLIVSLLGFSACDSNEKESEETENEDSTEHLYETKWVVDELNGETVVQTNEEHDLPYLVLRKEESRVLGSGGCNRYNGSFKLEGTSIAFSNVAATKMFCEDTMQTEDAYFTTLQEVASFELTEDSLTFLNNSGETIIKLQAE